LGSSNLPHSMHRHTCTSGSHKGSHRRRLRTSDALLTLLLALAAWMQCSSSRIGETFLQVPRAGTRRRLLPCVGLAAFTKPLRVHAEEEGSPKRSTSLYQGKVNNLRIAVDWYRFVVGDLIIQGTGSTAPDRLKPDDAGCQGGCAAQAALDSVAKLLSSGTNGRNGMVPLSPIDREIVTPMLTMATMNVLDPDTSEVVESRAQDFQITLQNLRSSARALDYKATQKLYTESLQRLNAFFEASNSGVGAQSGDDLFLTRVPLEDSELQSDPYWQERRQGFADRNYGKTQGVSPLQALAAVPFVLR